MIVLFALAAALASSCNDPQSQSEMTQCAGLEFEQADAALNRQWGVTVAAMKAADQDLDTTLDKRSGYYAALLASQRAWLQFRDTQCQVDGYQMRGGSAEPMLVSSCKARMTEERTRELKHLAEGD